MLHKALRYLGGPAAEGGAVICWSSRQMIGPLGGVVALAGGARGGGEPAAGPGGAVEAAVVSPLRPPGAAGTG